MDNPASEVLDLSFDETRHPLHQRGIPLPDDALNVVSVCEADNQLLLTTAPLTLASPAPCANASIPLASPVALSIVRPPVSSSLVTLAPHANFASGFVLQPRPPVIATGNSSPYSNAVNAAALEGHVAGVAASSLLSSKRKSTASSTSSGGARTFGERKRHRTDRLNEYFQDEAGVIKNGNRVMNSRCRENNCEMLISGRDNRSRRFHVILCPDIPLRVREYWWPNSKEENKPPILKHPFPNMTVAHAKKYVSNASTHMMNMIFSDVINPTAWDVDPIYAPFAHKKRDIVEGRPANRCSSVEQQIANLLSARLFIDENLPFALLDKEKGRDRAYTEYARFIRSGIQVPSAFQLRGVTDEYHALIKGRVLSELGNLLEEGFGTLTFDSSEDINGSPMTNVLRCNALYYAKIAKQIINEWIGMEKVAGIVTDNTGSVKSARETLTRYFQGVVASQDQAHVADLLMSDIGEVPWIRDVIQTISELVVLYRKHRRVKEVLLEKIRDYNSALRQKSRKNIVQSEDHVQSNDVNQTGQPALAAETGVNRLSGSNSNVHTRRSETLLGHAGPSEGNDGDQIANESRNEVLLLLHLPSEGYREVQNVIDENADCGEDIPASTESKAGDADVVGKEGISRGSSFTPSILPTAKLMKKVTAVRFASARNLLEEFRSVRHLLHDMVTEERFDELFAARTETEKEARSQTFTDPILSEERFARAEQAHGILVACRTYLRIFDSETSLCSEVYEATRILEESLQKLPIENYPYQAEKNRDHLLNVFRNRKEGPLPGMKRVRITLLSDLHIAAALLDAYRTPRKNLGRHLARFRRYLKDYFAGGVVNLTEATMEPFTSENVFQYQEVRASGSCISALQRSKGSRGLISFCMDGSIDCPRDPFRRQALDALIEFAYAHNLQTFVEDQTKPVQNLRRMHRVIAQAYREGKRARERNMGMGATGSVITTSQYAAQAAARVSQRRVAPLSGQSQGRAITTSSTPSERK
ncbi:hypothetical protein FGB62_176g08 [Gracilaria domingensis]|nr:hypothetical protein FGB62_176g08 [Gracilaria domingensis]